ncbi:MAG TPA: PIG-L deacetylase family protein [Patescibacteria group bacterium]|nr:PIG-L deacetylase family protein [Patescibacteria group bacterium]
MKNLVCVFAHPDDESFGPGGTIAKFSKKYNVYILSATKGDAGQSSIRSKNLGEVRSEELKKAAKILGVKKVYFLGFKDGTLNNNIYHKLASKIEEKLKILKPEIVLTFEPQGISGHIDHITISMVTMFAVQKLKFIKEVWQHCRPQGYDKFIKNYFIYFPKGYKKSQIQKVVKTNDVWEKKLEAMRAHKSQAADFERVLKIQSKLPKEEYFLVIKP